MSDGFTDALVGKFVHCGCMAAGYTKVTCLKHQEAAAIIPGDGVIRTYDDRGIIQPTEGIKYDEGKVRMELLPTKPLVDIAEVLTFGANKYKDDNWRKGISYKRVYGALQRHLSEWNDNRDLDPETKKNHLAHAGCCILFLLEYTHTKPEFDDRYKGDK